MNDQKYLYIVAILSIVLLCSCEKQDVFTYEQNGGVYFTGLNKEDDLFTYEYSFIRNPGVTQDTIYLPVNITGGTSDKDRTFGVEIVAGENTNALTEHYSLLWSKVPAGEITGSVAIQVNYASEMDDNMYSLELGIVSSESFPLLDFAINNYKVTISNLFTEPQYWDVYHSYFFGDYSSGLYRFIVKETGDPYFASSKTSQFLEWQFYYGYYGAALAHRFSKNPTLASYKSLVKKALIEYKKENGTPMLHNDGDKAGEVIVLPD